eukprot:7544386-Alexandrium_andersonii.AAC.1
MSPQGPEPAGPARTSGSPAQPTRWGPTRPMAGAGDGPRLARTRAGPSGLARPGGPRPLS